MTEAFVPPKPNEFERTVRTRAGRAVVCDDVEIMRWIAQRGS